MAAQRSSRKWVPVLAVLLAAVLGASSEPLRGFGGFLGGGETSPEESSTTPRSGHGSGGGIVGSVIGAFGSLGRRPSHQPPTPAGHVANSPAPAPTSARTPTSAAAATTPATAPSAPPVTSSSAAATPTAAATAPPVPSTSTSATRDPTSSSGMEMEISERSRNASGTSKPTEVCKQNWEGVGNETVNNNVDVLTVLLEHGGVPGQLGNLNWTSNTTNPKDPTKPDPDRWTYFYGDTDYKTFIRVERGSVHSRQTPGERALPEEVKGDIWWEPENFCGKLRHAKYYLWAPHCENQTCKVLPVIDDRDIFTIVKTKQTAGFSLCTGGEACDYYDDNRISAALLASLAVGG